MSAYAYERPRLHQEWPRCTGRTSIHRVCPGSVSGVLLRGLGSRVEVELPPHFRVCSAVLICVTDQSFHGKVGSNRWGTTEMFAAFPGAPGGANALGDRRDARDVCGGSGEGNG